MTMTGDTQHLTLAELAASGGTSPLPAQAAAHLAACAACQARSRAAVGDGVRFLLARCQPPPGLLRGVFDAIDTPPAAARQRLAGGGHRRWPAVRRYNGAQRVVLTAAAAVLLGAAGAGLVTALRSAGQSGGAVERGGRGVVHTGVTATGCPGLQVAGGMLLRINGTSLVLASELRRDSAGERWVLGPGGRQVTVTISAGTEVLREVAGTAADITNGAHVLVAGTGTSAAVAATLVGIMPGTGSVLPVIPLGMPAGVTSRVADGTVTGARGTGFTVIEQDGTRVRVTMSPSSLVVTTVRSSLGQLRLGEITSAAGSAGPHGTLAAVTVEQNALPPGTLENSVPKPLAAGPGPGAGLPGSLPGPGLPRSLYSPGLAGPLPSPGLPVTLPPRSAIRGLLPYLPGAGSPFASLGCAPSAITSADLLALDG